MDLKQTDTVVDWYIVFRTSSLDHWVYKLMDPFFQHVYAVKKSEGGCFWIRVDYYISHTTVDIVPIEKYPTIRDYVGDDAVIIPVSATISKRDRGGFNWFNCVEVVKSLLGIKDFWIWTPYQLYKHLTGKTHVDN